MFIYILLYGLVYSLIISKTLTNLNTTVTLIVSSIGLGLLGFGYANHFRKRGLIIGIIVVIIHLLIIKLISFFSTNVFDINALKVCIQILMGGIGGILGGNIKKIF
jgi:putative membrane protein (TIGR04086 family)